MQESRILEGSYNRRINHWCSAEDSKVSLDVNTVSIKKGSYNHKNTNSKPLFLYTKFCRRGHLREIWRKGLQSLQQVYWFPSVDGHHVVWSSVIVREGEGTLSLLRTSDSGWDRINTRIWIWHKDINNYTRKQQSCAGAGPREGESIWFKPWV